MSTNLLYAVEYDYDRKECGEECSCRSGDYCRDNYYVNLRAIAVNKKSVLDSFAQAYGFTENLYFLERLLSCYDYYDPNHYEIVTVRGYYGQEVEGMYLHNENVLAQRISEIKNAPFSEAVKLLLKEEYGVLLPQLVEAEFKKDTIKLSEIVPPDWMPKKSERGFYENYEGIIGIFQKKQNRYRIIDGHHRYLDLLSKHGADYVCEAIYCESN